jgi:hypothetical protein
MKNLEKGASNLSEKELIYYKSIGIYFQTIIRELSRGNENAA